MTKSSDSGPVKKILIPTDFSGNAYNAVMYGVKLAESLKCTAILFHSAHLPKIGRLEDVISGAGLNREDELNAGLSNLKQQMLSAHQNVNIETLLSGGFAVEEIIRCVKEHKIDLVVMGTKGAGAISQVLIGSNTAKVIEMCPCPVLAIPENAGLGSLDKIVFATNFADNDFQSIYLLAGIFKPFNPEITILHIGDRTDLNIEKKMFDWFKEQISTTIPYDNFKFEMIDSTNVLESLNRFVEDNSVNVISASTRKRKFFDKLTSRSLTKKLAYHSHIPLLAFHAQHSGGVPLF
ncbi:MAG: universal stress protein [Bacteroidetes bacterium]|nr:MAG: universal stress protein [Bacteroidota bacterium]REK05253.1 MAG: universal stress protein [Bacteroidota bacterium]REK32658.1 MAG: universal stress protein [Bacteroidota bacterium]REK48895.1 MAG: universal stress protein [Bacteroidota bacterium]